MINTLPSLPEPTDYGRGLYTADQMREYARAVLAQQFADGERQMLLTALEGIEQTACCNHWLGMNESRRRYAIARDARIAIDRANGLRPYAAPQPAPARVPRTLTEEQLERHGISASECPPNSQVMLVSSIRRLLGYAGTPAKEAP